MENKRLKIGILGLGLIGGSILKALHSLDKYELFAVSKSSYKEASEYGKTSPEIDILKDCDVIFVCSKMKDTKSNLKKLEDVVRDDAVVADVCSIKGFLNDNYRFNYVPSHPMAGTEFSGFNHSFGELFYGAKWIIGSENEILKNVIIDMGAKPVLMSFDKHDVAAAKISHLPMLISMALFDSADNDAKKIAASGFRDTTRLAMTNADLAYDMLNLNRENILDAYKKFNEHFEKIVSLDEEEFKKYVETIAQKRTQMYDENGKNTF